ncbi:MAG: ABC transporter permease [Bacillota bacterium]
MRFKYYLIKTLKENWRDWKVLLLTLAFAPCFIFILYGAYGNTNHSYNIVLINKDNADGKSHSEEVINLLKETKYPDGIPVYNISFSNSVEDSMEKLENRTVDALAVFPEDLTETLNVAAVNSNYSPTKLKIFGDPRNSRYAVAAIFLLTDFEHYVKSVTHTKVPVELDEILIGEGKAITDFDLYVPGIIVLALLNIMFTAGVSLIKEIEKGTMLRLVMSRIKTVEFFGAISVLQIALGLVSMVLALVVALVCGFEFKGSYAALVIAGMVSGIGVIGLSMITVSFLKSVYDLMTVGIIPYFIVMFFSGIFFPLPPFQVASFGENIIRLNDFLPLSLTVTALNKVLNFGAGIADIGFELIATLIISIVYCTIGLALFNRRHMRLL